MTMHNTLFRVGRIFSLDALSSPFAPSVGSHLIDPNDLDAFLREHKVLTNRRPAAISMLLELAPNSAPKADHKQGK